MIFPSLGDTCKILFPNYNRSHSQVLGIRASMFLEDSIHPIAESIFYFHFPSQETRVGY